MAVLNWDHTMINVQDVDEAVQFFGEHGIVFARGGRHEKWGTENALGYFGLNYIELISVYDEARAKDFSRSDASAVYDAVQDYEQKLQRINTIALRTSDIEATHARLKQAGVPAGDIEVGKRLNEQGHLITWSIFFIDGTIDGLPYPFFIQWQGSDETRAQKLTEQGLIVQHAAGDLLARQAVFHVPDPQKAADVWGRLLEGNPEKTERGYRIQLQDRQLIFDQGAENHIVQLKFDGAGDPLKQQTLVFDQIKLSFN
ncbi:VOC family protein [Sporolactobacillus terrae]|uniref:VOC family protein n=1 Tax=Sporolactobacillus terrae TaxID=269673 RepID=A0ABX5Q426_9BACL|nr:VOC family protein [Sporolactobacillus terrae]QAA21391.1 VOC family protein [Sporolactobacillus terrae]QAA24363.1 VOC family protein [Sporolactobacillus terrae]UAK16184.1 VOC family protein [Sporolactobacillus terrae]